MAAVPVYSVLNACLAIWQIEIKYLRVRVCSVWLFVPRSLDESSTKFVSCHCKVFVEEAALPDAERVRDAHVATLIWAVGQSWAVALGLN